MSTDNPTLLPPEASELTDDEVRRRVLDAAFLRLAAGGGWSQVSLAAAAKAADVPIARLYRLFPCRAALLPALMAETDRRTLESLANDPIDGETERDRLFDLVMRRFEFLAPYQLSLRAVAADVFWSPSAVMAAGLGLGRSMSWMLTGAGLLFNGPRGVAQVSGLAVVWLATFRVWLHDSSADLGPTMAALNNGLERAERTGRFVGMGF